MEALTKALAREDHINTASKLSRDAAACQYRELLSAAAREGDVNDVSCATRLAQLAPAAIKLGRTAFQVQSDLRTLSQASALLDIEADAPRRKAQVAQARQQLTDAVLDAETAITQAQAAVKHKRAAGRLTASDVDSSERRIADTRAGVAVQRVGLDDGVRLAQSRYDACLAARAKFDSLSRQFPGLIDESLLRRSA